MGNNELLWFLMLLINFGGISLGYRLFGKSGLYCWVAMAAIVANIQVIKTVELFWITATLGNIVYATTFLATDILSECYGKKEARKAVWIGFFSLVAMTVLMNLALLFKPHPTDFSQDALKTIFALMPRIAAASLTAYLISQFHDVLAFHFWKRKTAGKYLWLRNNASTIVSQLIDSVVFVLIAFYGIFPTPVLWEIFWSTYIFKGAIAMMDTPFVYLARLWTERGVIPSSASAGGASDEVC